MFLKHYLKKKKKKSKFTLNLCFLKQNFQNYPSYKIKNKILDIPNLIIRVLDKACFYKYNFLIKKNKTLKQASSYWPKHKG